MNSSEWIKNDKHFQDKALPIRRNISEVSQSGVITGIVINKWVLVSSQPASLYLRILLAAQLAYF